MLPAEAATPEGRTANDNATVRSVFIIGPDKKMKAMLIYPMSAGRNFDEVLRLIHAVQLTRKHPVATPVNWKQGDDVIIAGSVTGRKTPRGAPALPAHRAASALGRKDSVLGPPRRGGWGHGFVARGRCPRRSSSP